MGESVQPTRMTASNASAHRTLRSLTARRGLLIVVVGVALVLGMLFASRAFLWGRLSPQADTVIGSMNGVKLSIPRPYLFVPVEYLGETVWAPRKDKPVRTYESRISNFSVYAQYQPDSRTFRPLTGKINRESYVKSLRTNGPHDWFMVSPISFELTDDMKHQLAGRIQLEKAKGLNRLLEGRLSGQYFDKDAKGQSVVHYEILGLDKALKLNRATPVGPGVGQFHSWNQALYWAGERDSTITTYIECWNGALTAGGIGKCEQHYYLRELDANVTVDYTSNWLAYWESIQEHTTLLLMSFAVSNSKLH